MEITSKANNVRQSPKKLRKVANCVRGLNVNKALSSLKHMNEKGAEIVEKTLSSAIANAVNNESFEKDMNTVVIKTITAQSNLISKTYCFENNFPDLINLRDIILPAITIRASHLPIYLSVGEI